ncbi:DegT/DnrJ/EryC1/StrS family aminotransferase [Methanoplanus sp. FWC-SCC4]|uniref:DegT/DnrJ/EryC1/StrS family aminotransferase n=1 Tax=Methanochimaera problematica TaxID=2609417 RepID=A0AA97FAH0_9EURY|nr:DegT/DnrJ/EryC1/StrS family aminotransferase [Methanoplanus sp. FWC-SCC4]WOF15384.1 DegT/DnrJ/EryC1/StrS family aminotransferase [Methanoplanus sp. FWC-SCC4]
MRDYIPFGKPNFSEEEIQEVTRVLKSGWIGMGSETISFENELKDYFDVSNVVCVNSCTSALYLSLLALGVKSGDEVICPSYTWCSTANAALYLGAKPVFCDIDPNSYCITPESVSDKITDKTKAVIPVHMGGIAADIDGISEVMPKKCHIIEDAAHAIGSKFPNDLPVGSSGNLTCFSFYANKNLSTGEGGAIALNDNKIAEKLRSFRLHGLSSDAWNRFIDPKSKIVPEIHELGFKMNYTDLNASIGRVQLRRLGELFNRRAEIADYYVDIIQKLPYHVKIQKNILSPGHAKHLFLIELPLDDIEITRDEFVLKMRDFGIGASIHYLPLHMMDYYKGIDNCKLVKTENLYERVMTLPISASMTIKDAEYVMEVFSKIMEGTI